MSALGGLAALLALATLAGVNLTCACRCPSPAATPAQPVAQASTSSAAAPAPPASNAGATRVRSEPPKTREACAACRGEWGVHGLAKIESCICRTTDAGKRCRDGNECEGKCLVNDQSPEFEVTVAGTGANPPRGFFVGRCSELVTVFGCNRYLEAGTLTRPPVPRDDLPVMLCVD